MQCSIQGDGGLFPYDARLEYLRLANESSCIIQ